MSTETTKTANVKNRRLVIIAAMIATVFVASYAYANAAKGGASTRPAFDTTGAYGAASGGYADPNAADPNAAGAGCGGGCCGGGSTEPIEAETTVEDGVQRIAVDTSSGSFDPNVIRAKAGVPIEIEFSQAPGGCLAGVMFADFNVYEDLTAGSKTIELPALEPGEYAFSCQMQMVYGTLIVE